MCGIPARWCVSLLRRSFPTRWARSATRVQLAAGSRIFRSRRQPDTLLPGPRAPAVRAALRVFQPAEPYQLQYSVGHAELADLWKDPERRRSTHPAVRAEVFVLR